MATTLRLTHMSNSVQIFVDDSDPEIEYGLGWTQEFFDVTNSTEFPSFPFYGTAHLVDNAFPSANFSYTFNGQVVPKASMEGCNRMI